jgi:iron complex outermembrane recepter protein
MKRSHPLCRYVSIAPTFLAAWLAFGAVSMAQPPLTGTIEGRVFNPLTGEYVRNAEVRVQGTPIVAITAGDGRYRLGNVSTGAVTLTVTYTGYQPASATVTVGRGEIITRDFDLQSSISPGNDKVVALDTLTVSSRREGTAKAIMEQRVAMTVKNVIASDTFGDMMEGNIAEVLQYLPGMEVVYCGGDPLSFSGRGLAAKYSALTMDGVRTGGAAGARQPHLIQYSANAADTIEFSKTNSADMDADAPGGSVNLRSKSAFQRKGRFFSYQLYALANSYQLHLGKSDGPNDGQTYKTLPGAIIDFSDVYLGGKLGVVVNLSESNSSNEQAILTYTYNTTPTPASPEPVLLTTIAYTNGPKVNRRQGGGLNLEYKLTPAVTLALRGQFNTEDARIYNRQFQLVSARGNLAPGSNHLVMIAPPTTTNVTRFAIAGTTTNRSRSNHSFAPSVTYEGKKLNVDATFSYNRAGEYQRVGRFDSNSASVAAVNMQLFGVGFVASRDSADSTQIAFQQTAGPDLYDLRNWRSTSLTNNITRTPTEPTSKQLLGQINAKYTTDWATPTFFKVGAKTSVNRFFQTSGSYSWTYVGPGGNRLTADLPVSVYRFFDWTGTNLFSDRKIEFPDRQALGSALQKNPEYFIPNPADATSAANLLPNRSAREYIDAAYGMANTRLGRMTLQGGVRYEMTETRAMVIERGVANERVGEHDDIFFSGAARYRFTDHLMTIASFSQSMLRAELPGKSAVATINEAALTGTIPNPDLKPEYGNNYSVRLEYYFEPVGVLSGGLFMMDVEDYQFAASGVPAEEIGLGDEYPGFLFSTQGNAPGFDIRGYELEYSQQLTFLPGIFRGFGLFGNYARTKYSDPQLAYGRAPQTASAGISLRYRRLNSALRWSWTPDTLTADTTYRKARHMLGSSLSYQLTQHTSLFLTGRNLLNAPITTYRRDLPGYIQGKNKYGSNWTFGVKGTY